MQKPSYIIYDGAKEGKGMRNHRRWGFTLLETVVVVGLIGILATLVTYNGAVARQKARDARRKSDVTTIMNALGLYQQLTGTLPAFAVSSGGQQIQGVNLSSQSPWLQPLVDRKILTDVPHDPVEGRKLIGAAHSSLRAYAVGEGGFLNCTPTFITPTSIGGGGLGTVTPGATITPGGAGGINNCTPTPGTIEPYVGQDQYQYALYTKSADKVGPLLNAAFAQTIVCAALEHDHSDTLEEGHPAAINPPQLIALGFYPLDFCQML